MVVKYLPPEVAQRLATKPATVGHPIAPDNQPTSYDWKLHVERLSGDEAGAVWDMSEWATGAGDTNPDVWIWATLEWESLNDVCRGIEWLKGADQPHGRPRNGEIVVTLRNDIDGVNDPWVNYSNTRPGTIMRAGLASQFDTRAGGWIPLWAGVVESWDINYVGARASGYRADSYAEIHLIETMAWLARTDANALGAPVGSGDSVVDRTRRLLVDAEWPFGQISMFDSTGESAIALQSTVMSANRLAELYLTADSTNSIVRSDATGACLVTNKDAFDMPSRLSEFTFFDFFGSDIPMFVFAGEDDTTGDLWQFAYDPDSVETVNDPEGIVNDHRYSRVGGTQQVFEHPVSIGQFGRSTRARSDLIMTTDAAALAVAEADNDREARTALRIDAIEIVATGRHNALLAVAAADHNDQVWVFPPASSGFTGSAVGHIRAVTHTVTPLTLSGVHWTTSFALDLYSFNNLPGSILPEA